MDAPECIISLLEEATAAPPRLLLHAANTSPQTRHRLAQFRTIYFSRVHLPPSCASCGVSPPPPTTKCVPRTSSRAGAAPSLALRTGREG